MKTKLFFFSGSMNILSLSRTFSVLHVHLLTSGGDFFLKAIFLIAPSSSCKKILMDRQGCEGQVYKKWPKTLKHVLRLLGSASRAPSARRHRYCEIFG